MTSRTAGVLAAPNRERTMPGCAAAAATPAGPQRRASSRVEQHVLQLAGGVGAQRSVRPLRVEIVQDH